MKKIFSILVFILILSNGYAAEVILNYTPGGYTGAGNSNDDVEKNNVFDNTGLFYFSRLSLALCGSPKILL